MHEKPFTSIHFDWLANPEGVDVAIAPIPLGDLPSTPIGLPPEYGTVFYSQHILALGMSFNSIKSTFTAEAFGRVLPGMVAKVEFEEPTFQAVVLRGLRAVCQERYPPAHLAFSEGLGLFRYTDHYDSQMSADGSYSGTSVIVSIRKTVLNQLIGHASAQALLAGLNLRQQPAISVRPIPLHISQHLMDGLAPHLSGALLKLHMQAKVLQYLVALVDYVCAEPGEPLAQFDTRARERTRAIHEQLLDCEGKLPTLDELAMQYGRSAKLLNEEFAREFGQSIFAFMLNFRLNQAHAALAGSDVSIKQLASRLGYAHVSNFSIAFKKKFGFPPGSLRRRKP